VTAAAAACGRTESEKEFQLDKEEKEKIDYEKIGSRVASLGFAYVSVCIEK
jgi:hypothetical protein